MRTEAYCRACECLTHWVEAFTTSGWECSTCGWRHPRCVVCSTPESPIQEGAVAICDDCCETIPACGGAEDYPEGP